MATSKLSLDNVLLAAQLTKGNISEASDRLGVSRQGLYKYLKKTPRAQEAFAEWRERLIDRAEQKLWECVDERQPWAIALVLKTVGQRRGYTERSVPTQPGDQGEVRLYWPEEQEAIERRVIYLPHKETTEARERIAAKLEEMAERQAAYAPESVSAEAEADLPARLTELPALVHAQDVAGVVRLITELLGEDSE
jgi:hypothetical protein